MNRPSIVARALLGLIRLYQFTFSTIMGKQCRFYPSCSNYTAEAIRRYGAGKGGLLGIKRILRCHPGNPGGHDPVPDKICSHTGTCDKTP
jgi:putative membrane protein insertion efficiency factor